ncbi:MAG: hypothetical protein OEW64_04230 [Gammaproteobacteria bacterium]|nr:hypothetical protein [Gammaproteobacteria bacterium]MDH5303286.1 hypothetical protein [Gammaproteobacteria bacterium]MDH5323345.1 hypothetical protein [Gammaproteobacteria bacterium]
MRRIVIALLLATTSIAAHADLPDGHQSWLDLLAHQLGSAHHLPALLPLVLVGILLIHRLLRAMTGNH